MTQVGISTLLMTAHLVSKPGLYLSADNVHSKNTSRIVISYILVTREFAFPAENDFELVVFWCLGAPITRHSDTYVDNIHAQTIVYTTLRSKKVDNWLL
jgi:hypothetical protein